MKKLRLKDLHALAHEMNQVSEKEQRGFVGGGTGSNLDPFSQDEYRTMQANGTWEGGFVMGDAQDPLGASLQYIPSSSHGTEEETWTDADAKNGLFSLFENHQIMTMSLEAEDGENYCDLPSGYWDGSGFMTESGYLDISGYWDGSGFMTESGYWDGSGWIDLAEMSGDWDKDGGVFPELPVDGNRGGGGLPGGGGDGNFGDGFNDILGIFGGGNNNGGNDSSGIGHTGIPGGGGHPGGNDGGGGGNIPDNGEENDSDSEKDPVQTFRENIESKYKLTEAQKDFLDTVDIRYDESAKNSQYDPEKNILIINSTYIGEDSLRHEMAHAYQDKVLDALDNAKSHSNAEFQVYMVENISTLVTGTYKITDDKIPVLYEWIDTYVSEIEDKATKERTICVDEKGFSSSSFNELYEGFRDYHEELASKAENDEDMAAFRRYAEAPDPQYKWEWEKLLNFYGIVVK